MYITYFVLYNNTRVSYSLVNKKKAKCILQEKNVLVGRCLNSRSFQNKNRNDDLQSVHVRSDGRVHLLSRVETTTTVGHGSRAGELYLHISVILRNWYRNTNSSMA
jgi:hypothetical protein